jgi:uncharacterized protein YxjI
MSKTAILSTSKAIFIGFQAIFDDKEQKTDNVYVNFAADEYVPDYDIVLGAEQIVSSTKKKIKANLRFRLSVDAAKALALETNNLYSIEYASEASAFGSDEKVVAYSRKWLRSVQPFQKAS